MTKGLNVGKVEGMLTTHTAAIAYLPSAAFFNMTLALLSFRLDAVCCGAAMALQVSQLSRYSQRTVRGVSNGSPAAQSIAVSSD